MKWVEIRRVLSCALWKYVFIKKSLWMSIEILHLGLQTCTEDMCREYLRSSSHPGCIDPTEGSRSLKILKRNKIKPPGHPK